MITKSSVVEIQNLVVNPKSLHVKLNSEQYQFYLRGYLRYKMITSQNTLSEAWVKHFFHRKVMFHSRDIRVFVFLTIP